MQELSAGGVYDPKNGGYFTPPAKPDYTPVDPRQLQPNIPAQFAGGVADPHGDPNYDAEIAASIHPTDLAALDAKPAPTSGPFKVNPGDKPDVVRMKKNGGQPVIMLSPDQLTPSSLGQTPSEYTVWYKESGCIQPPKGFDSGKATAEERNAYGFPPLHPDESVSAYDARVSWMKTRSCEYRYGNINMAPLRANGATTAAQSSHATQATRASSVPGNSPIMFSTSGPYYTGNFADEPCVEAQHQYGCSSAGDQYDYNDTWSQWTLKGISGNNPADEIGVWSQWMGLGGITSNPIYGQHPDALDQSGSQDWAESGCYPTTCNLYGLWVENLTNYLCGSSYCEQDPAVFPWGQASTHYGITVYAEEWGQSNGWNAESEVGDETDGLWYSTNSFYNGHNYGFATESAEAIVENTSGANAKFSSVTFNGIAVYDSKAAQTKGMDNSWHDYFKSWGSCSDWLDSIGSLVTNNNYSPPVDNTITWSWYC